MEFFERLADCVVALSSALGVSGAAKLALEELPPPEYLSAEDIVSWVWSSKELPRQQDLDAYFGDAAVTAAQREGFHIQVLFWQDGTTAVHQHAFEGAFAVMQGASVHVQYTFDIEDDSLPHFVRGRRNYSHVEILKRGDVRAISRGADFVHSVFHLDQPTITVVIRTAFDTAPGPQLSYTCRLGIDPFRRDPEDIRKLQFVDLALGCLPSSVEGGLTGLLASSELPLCYAILERVILKHGSIRAVQQYLPILEQRYPSYTGGLSESLEDSLRIQNIVQRRGVVRHRDHRTLLALLLTMPDRPSLLESVGAIYGGEQPVQLICSWLRELTSQKVDPVWGPNVLGIELGEPGVAFIEAVLQGVDIDGAAAMASSDSKTRARLILTLPRCGLLKPLFAS